MQVWKLIFEKYRSARRLWRFASFLTYTDSTGALLVAVEDGFGLVSVLEREGIHAAVIGRTNDGNDRIIYNQGKKRYLDRPQKEKLEKVFD